MFIVVYSRKAEKFLLELSDKIRGPICEEIEKLSQNPYPHGVKKLKGKLASAYRIRVGDYRVIYDIYIRDRRLFITTIGHRKESYR